MSLDDVVVELLVGPLNEFTSRRNSKSKELKAAGQRELAAEVAKLKKPPVAVWAVNQLARSNKPVLERLRRAGEAVVQAQSGAVAGRKNAALELRAASDALQRELEVAVQAAGEVLRADGHAADEATRRRVQEMLRLAAVSGGETWDRLHRGALISEPRAGEDMLTAAFALGPGGGSGAESTRARANGEKAARSAAREAAATEKRIEMEHVLRTAKADEEAAQQAEQTAHRLREEADRIGADAKRASEKARQAEKELERASARAKASRDEARRISRRR
jgi:t-SNARE complex subunit (syntaxin)